MRTPKVDHTLAQRHDWIRMKRILSEWLRLESTCMEWICTVCLVNGHVWYMSASKLHNIHEWCSKKKWNNVCGFSNHARISLLYAKPSPCKKHIYWVGTFRKKTSSPDNEQVDLRVFLKVSPQNCLCQLHQLPPKHTSLPLWPTSTKPPQQKHLPSPNGDFCCILREGFPSDVPSKKCTKGTEERKDAKCATRPKSMTCAVSLRPKPPGEWEPNRSG